MQKTNYRVSVSGVVENEEKNFGCSFKVNVKNGGNVEEVGAVLQGAISAMELNSIKKVLPELPEEDQPQRSPRS